MFRFEPTTGQPALHVRSISASGWRFPFFPVEFLLLFRTSTVLSVFTKRISSRSEAKPWSSRYVQSFYFVFLSARILFFGYEFDYRVCVTLSSVHKFLCVAPSDYEVIEVVHFPDGVAKCVWQIAIAWPVRPTETAS